MRLAWTRPAQRDRARIRAYVATDNPRAALALDELIAVKAARLAEHPHLGRPCRVEGTRELIAHRNYILVYDIADDLVRILRVLHAARQWPPPTAQREQGHHLPPLRPGEDVNYGYSAPSGGSSIHIAL